MKKTTPTDFEPNDFVIRLRPHMEQEEWNGDVDISIMWDGSNHLSEDDFFRFMHLVKMICASVPMMEDNPVLRNDISDFVYESYSTLENDKPVPQNQAEILDRQGNVVYLSFNTKTKGSA
tara:strand:- start:702 stop:1061 length:360 start_codon:yes stop_codon:yes gene_type:complete